MQNKSYTYHIVYCIHKAALRNEISWGEATHTQKWMNVEKKNVKLQRKLNHWKWKMKRNLRKGSETTAFEKIRKENEEKKLQAIVATKLV